VLQEIILNMDKIYAKLEDVRLDSISIQELEYVNFAMQIATNVLVLMPTVQAVR